MAVVTLLNQLGVVSGTPWTRVRYFSTTRQGGVSKPPFNGLNLATHVADAAKDVATNRELLAAALGAMPLWLEQVHGTDVFDADTHTRDAYEFQGPVAVADAAVTSRPGVVLAVLTADCLPVVIADDQGRAVGVAHAGWRGLAAGVLENTLQVLRARLPAGAVLRAWIGPAISQGVFEVGADVYQAFCDSNPENRAYFVTRLPGAPDAPPKWLADLPGIARQQLVRAGALNVECSGWCTLRNPDLFYSYRSQAVTGRMATLVWIDSATDLP